MGRAARTGRPCRTGTVVLPSRGRASLQALGASAYLEPTTMTIDSEPAPTALDDTPIPDRIWDGLVAWMRGTFAVIGAALAISATLGYPRRAPVVPALSRRAPRRVHGGPAGSARRADGRGVGTTARAARELVGPARRQ